MAEPVAGVGPASATRSWRFDPTITVERNIADDKGRVIIAAGTRVNPLDTVPLRAPLVFLDGDDPAQLAWAARRFAATRAKLIVVAAPPTLTLVQVPATVSVLLDPPTLRALPSAQSISAVVPNEP